MISFSAVGTAREWARAYSRHRTLLFALGTMLTIAAGGVGAARGQALTDPGFESYAASSGGFVKPAVGPWLFANDAGVVEPFAPNSSTGALNTWSATFAAVEGEQYASTYAGGDSLRQSVEFPAAGDYRISVYAAAPDGSVTIPNVATLALVDGEFAFTLAGAVIGSGQVVPAGSSWNLYTADFTVSAPGSYLLGVRNTKLAPYFINYDAFSVQVVPEPATLPLALAIGAAALAARARRRTRRCG